MTEATTSRASSLTALITGRSGRARYWIAMGVYFAVYVSATYAHLPFLLLQVALPLVWIALIAAPRLHDFGRSVGWAFTPMATGFVGGFVLGFWKALSSPDPSLLARAGVIEQLLVGLVSVAFMIWLGAVPSNTGPNRFGPSPGSKAAHDVAKVFE
jgi:uncharacterized membrane protein YhaH (DUF805 family)